MTYQWIIDALETTWDTIDSTVRSSDESDLDLATSCPGWSVRDVLAHVIGFELLTAGTAVPAFTGAWPSHVHNEVGQWNEAFVQWLRSYDAAALLALFRETTRDTLARLRDLDDESWEKVGWSPEGERPLHRFQETRVLDSWIHLGDIRDAFGDTEDDHGPGEEVVLDRFEAALPYVLVKRAGATDGTTLRVNLEGRLARSVLLEVIDGRARVNPSSEVAPALELTTTTALFWRRAAGRVSAEALLNAPVTDTRGDHDLVARFVEGLRVMI